MNIAQVQKKYDKIMRVVDSKIATIDLNKKDIIPDCRAMIHLLKEKLAEMKAFLRTHQFENEADEITFFKYQKPMLLGRLIYFHKILRIEIQSPLNSEELDKYYESQQEEQKSFFDRHVAFSNTTAVVVPIGIRFTFCVDGKRGWLIWRYVL